MPDMNENAETQQEYFGVRTDNKRTLCNALKRIEELEEKLANADYQLEGRDNEIRELEAQIKKMKCCGNCKNEKIEGACGHFTQVGWCRDWELAD